jgi:hypothetical protein
MVLLFQLAVVLTVGAAWLFYGKRASLYVTIAWSVWTLAAIQAGWLVILQGLVAWGTFAILPADYTEAREQLIRRLKMLMVIGLLGSAGFGVWFWAEYEASRSPAEEASYRETPRSSDPSSSEEDCEDAQDRGEQVWDCSY